MAPAGRPTLVIIHGLMSESLRYEALAQALHESGLGVMVVDLLNHGRSLKQEMGEGTTPRPTTFVEQAQAIAQVLSDAGVQNPVIYGHSYGGGVAAALTRIIPVAGLLLDKSWVSPVDQYYQQHSRNLVAGVSLLNPWAGFAWDMGIRLTTQLLMPSSLQEVLERGYDQSEILRSPHLSRRQQIDGAVQSYDQTPLLQLLPAQFRSPVRWRASGSDDVAPRPLIERLNQQLQAQGLDSRVESVSSESHLAVMDTPSVIAQWILREISQFPL